MDTRDGRMIGLNAWNALPPDERKHYQQMQLEPTPKQRRLNRVGRNDPCPCGSGLKFKKCCRTGA